MTTSVLDTLAPSAAPRKKNDSFAIQASGKADYKAKSLDDSDSGKSFADHMEETHRPAAESSSTPAPLKTAASKPSAAPASTETEIPNTDEQSTADGLATADPATVDPAAPLPIPSETAAAVIPVALDLATGQAAPLETVPQAVLPAATPALPSDLAPEALDSAALPSEAADAPVSTAPAAQTLRPVIAEATPAATDPALAIDAVNTAEADSLIKKATAPVTPSPLADTPATDTAEITPSPSSPVNSAIKTAQAGAIPLAQEGAADDATALDKTALLESVKAPARDDAVTPALNALEAKKNNPLFSKPDSDATVSSLGDTKPKDAAATAQSSNTDSGKTADQQTAPSKFVQMLEGKTESASQSATASGDTIAETGSIKTTTGATTQDTPDTQQQQPQTATVQSAATAARTYPPHVLAQAPAAIVQLGVEIAAQHRKGTSKFDIRLDPAELGSVDVRVEIDRYGRVKSHLIVEKAETLELLKADLRGLERALEQAGLRADPGSLSLNLRDPSQSNPFRDSEGSAFQQSPADDDSADTETAHVQIAYQSNNGSASGLDIRV